MVVATVIVGGIASALMIASHAVPDSQSQAQAAIQAAEAMDRMTDDLLQAITVSEHTNTAVTFTVGDRDQNDSAESICYAWSGTPGDALTRTYNESEPSVVLDNVQSLSIGYFLEARIPAAPLAVLLVVPNPSSLGTQDSARKAAIESWGHEVGLIAASASASVFTASVANSDVVYISSTTSGSDLCAELIDANIGIVNENADWANALRITAGTWGLDSYGNLVEIVDTTHLITASFATGNLTILQSTQPLYCAVGAVADGADVLALSVNSGEPIVVALEAGAARGGGGRAPARRVQLPWSSPTFATDSLSGDGLTLMQNALEWAAGSYVLTTAQVRVQVGEEAAGLLETQVQVLNEPKVSMQ
jgi:hypothetical protein